MKKLLKTLSTSLIAITIGLSTIGCGSTTNTNTSAASKEPGTLTKLTIGASAAPHAEILEFAKPLLKAKGIDLDVKIFTDYVLPNTALDSNELDANYFQHQPYLDDFNAKNGTDIISAGSIHFEPLGIYPGKSKDLKTIQDDATIAVPSDVTNEARALQLLSSLDIITLKEGVGLSATVKDITANPHNIKFTEVEAAQIPRVLSDVDFGVINGNYALEAKIDSTILSSEDKGSEGAQKFANIIGIKNGKQEDPTIKTLIEVLTSKEVTDFINTQYKGLVVPLS
ncbi:MAG: MetQ/NlpA family ABC transporter substrate-binding protein [Cellulosilyticaceae bacterium]